MSKKQRTQAANLEVVKALYNLKKRNEDVYIPFLRAKIAELKAKIEQTASPDAGNEA